MYYFNCLGDRDYVKSPGLRLASPNGLLAYEGKDFHFGIEPTLLPNETTQKLEPAVLLKGEIRF
jgi:hypothetical protein